MRRSSLHHQGEGELAWEAGDRSVGPTSPSQHAKSLGCPLCRDPRWSCWSVG